MNRTLFRATLATFAFAAALSTSTPISAQSKAETKLYNTALAKKDIKSANKFLSKYPNSTYAPKIQRIKDSLIFNNLNPNDVLAYISFVEQNPKSAFIKAANNKIEQLNQSSINDSQAMEIAINAGIEKASVMVAKGVKSRNIEHVIVILAPTGGYYTITTLANKNGNWETISQIQEAVYSNNTELNKFSIYTPCNSVTINGMQYIYFGYTNTSDATYSRSNIPINEKEIVLNLYSVDNNSVYNVLFSGKVAPDSYIYGSSMESTQSGLMANPEQAYLQRSLKGMESLKPYDKELFRTQETIQWWYENNPQNAGNLQFGIIPESSELVQLFKDYDQKEVVGLYTVAMFDICHNTVVVVHNNADNVYSLALCQPIPIKPDDLELSSFYGEKGNTLVLYYYKGKTSIKKRLNLGSKRLY